MRTLVHLRIDGEATADQLSRLEAHLRVCTACHEYADEMCGVMSGLSALAEATKLPPAVTGRPARRRFDDAVPRRVARSGMRLLRWAAAVGIVAAAGWYSLSRDGDITTTSRSPDERAPVVARRLAGPDTSAPRVPQRPVRTRVISARSVGTNYIPVRRKTSPANVSFFVLYRGVRSVSVR